MFAETSAAADGGGQTDYKCRQWAPLVRPRWLKPIKFNGRYLTEHLTPVNLGQLDCRQSPPRQTPAIYSVVVISNWMGTRKDQTGSISCINTCTPAPAIGIAIYTQCSLGHSKYYCQLSAPDSAWFCKFQNLLEKTWCYCCLMGLFCHRLGPPTLLKVSLFAPFPSVDCSHKND